MKKLLSILTVLALMLCLLPVSALAADELTLNIADGAIVITATGYSIDNAAEIPYTGSYIITGSANTTGPYKNLTVNGVADGASVTLKDLSIVTSGPPAIILNAPVKATGKIQASAPASTISCSTVTITGDADFTVTTTTGGPAFSAGQITLSCRTLHTDGGMGFSVGTINVTTTGDMKIKSNNPAIGGNNTTLKVGGNLEIEAANSLCFSVANAFVEAAGNITLNNSTAVSPTAYASDSLSLKAGGNITVNGGSSNGLLAPNKLTANAGGNLTVSTSGNSPTISSDNVDLTASGDISVTGSKSIAVNALATGSISAGGKLTLQGGASAPVYSGNSTSGTHTLQAKGDVLVKGPHLGITGNDVTVSGANVTVESTGNANAISCNSIKLAATGDVTLTCGQVTVSANKTAEITADGNVKITAKGTSPVVSTPEGFTLKAKKTVTIDSAYGIAISGKSAIEGSSVTVNSGKGGPAFTGETSLKATEGNLTITTQDENYPVFNSGKNSLYAAEEININTASNLVSADMPEMTFGKHLKMGGSVQTLFLGLDRVAVADGTDYLPKLKFTASVNGQTVTGTPTFTAKSGDKAVTAIKDAGTYACVATASLAIPGASGITTELPFNLIVRKAKPAVTPSTGDETNLGLLAVLAIASAASLAGVHFGRKFTA